MKVSWKKGDGFFPRGYEQSSYCLVKLEEAKRRALAKVARWKGARYLQQGVSGLVSKTSRGPGRAYSARVL